MEQVFPLQNYTFSTYLGPPYIFPTMIFPNQCLAMRSLNMSIDGCHVHPTMVCSWIILFAFVNWKNGTANDETKMATGNMFIANYNIHCIHLHVNDVNGWFRLGCWSGIWPKALADASTGPQCVHQLQGRRGMWSLSLKIVTLQLWIVFKKNANTMETHQNNILFCVYSIFCAHAFAGCWIQNGPGLLRHSKLEFGHFFCG